MVAISSMPQTHHFHESARGGRVAFEGCEGMTARRVQVGGTEQFNRPRGFPPAWAGRRAICPHGRARLQGFGARAGCAVRPPFPSQLALLPRPRGWYADLGKSRRRGRCMRTTLTIAAVLLAAAGLRAQNPPPKL